MDNRTLHLPPLFGDGMILQRDLPIRIFGTARRGGLLEVNFDGRETRREIDAGRFEMELPPHAAGRNLTMELRLGGDTLKFENVSCGEVWVAGGQSNMTLPLRETAEYEAEKPALGHPDIRLYTVGRNLFADPAAYPAGHAWACNPDRPWDGCGPRSAPFFSAVGYHFARTLAEELAVPVGVISCNVSGSSIFNWMPREVILDRPALAAVYTDFEKKLESVNPDEALAAYERYLSGVKDEYGAPAFLRENGGEHPAVYYEEFGPYSMKQPCNLYHSMLKRIARYTARGMIWYQGESESFSESSGLYTEAMEAFVDHVRALSGRDGYAFHYVQITPWRDAAIRDWEGICDAQRRFHLRHPGCGMVTTGDCGAGENIHSPIKKPVGRRLGAAACTLTYGLPRPYAGPIARRAWAQAGAVVVEFTHADGMTCRDGATVEVEYADGSVAEERCHGRENRLHVVCRRPDPVAVRHGWCSDYRIGLYNRDNLPASVFRLELEAAIPAEDARTA